MTISRPAGVLALGAALLLGACSNNDNDRPPAGSVDLSELDSTIAGRCDHLVPEHCLYPFPNNHFTMADERTDTGLRVNLDAASVPAAQPVTLPFMASPGGAFDPTEWNRNDGFSPGSMLLAKVPELDLAQTGAVRIGDVSKSLDTDAPIIVIDAQTGERQLIWTELDAQAGTPGQQALIIRPAKNFVEGRRYIAALRKLKKADGSAIEATPLFRAYRDKIDTEEEVYEARREAMEDIFDRLRSAGVRRSELYLAWDFTIASQRNITERMLQVRDEGFALLGGLSPEFTVTAVSDNPSSRISRRIDGTFRVPNFLDTAGGPTGSRFHYGGSSDPDALPQRNGNDFVTAQFRCQIAMSTVADFGDAGSPVTRARASLYGHGLLGSGINEVNAGNVRDMSDAHNVMFCATNWIGMASDDANVAGGNSTVHRLLADLKRMPALPDRSQQGFLAFMYLAELLKHPDGFASHAAFRHGSSNRLVYDPSEVFYDGNSQGGILGGAMIAAAPNVHRGVLGVPGGNYSLLLQRNNGFLTSFAIAMYPAYPNSLDRQLIFALQQMLWDRAENNGYLSHFAGRHLPNTPADKAVLLHVGLGDHQVTQWSAEIIARTIGAPIHEPTKRLGESPDENPYYAIDTISTYPYRGHALMVWDSGDFNPETNTGTPFPPSNNTAPMAGKDPHESVRRTPEAQEQKSEFMKRDGAVVNTCGDQPCRTFDYSGLSRTD
jgi:hypothetical protein